MQSNAVLPLADATLGIICALPKELAAVCEVFECADEPPLGMATSGRCYVLAQVAGRGGGRHTIAIAQLPDMGNDHSAIVATHLLADCPQVRHILMVGIAGGVPHPDKPSDHVRLGDIVISDRNGSIQYDLVKITAGAPIEHRHAPRAPSRMLLDADKWLQTKAARGRSPWKAHLERALATLGAMGTVWERPDDSEDVLDDGSGAIPHPADPEREPGSPRVFRGPIASANTLLKDPSIRDRIRDELKVKAVEMEGSGVADATWHDLAGYLVVRGICDYCNLKKGDGWQHNAALVAAAYARALIEAVPVPPAPSPDGRPGPESPTTPGYGRSGDPPIEYLYEKAYEHGRIAERSLLGMVPIAAGSGGTPSEGPSSAEARDLDPLRVAAAEAVIIPLLQRVQAELDRLELARSFQAAADVQRALGEHDSRLSPAILSDAYEVLATVEIVSVKLSRQQRDVTPVGTARARDLIARARRSGGGPGLGDSRPSLDAIEAAVDALDGEVEGALGKLAAIGEPKAVRLRLSILIDHERFSEAAAILRGLSPDRAWCSQAVSCLVQAGELDRSRELLEWASSEDDPDLRRRTLISYAESRMVAAFKSRGASRPIHPGDLGPDERAALEDMLQAIKPLLRSAEANERVANAIDEHGVTFALRGNLLLGNRTEAERLALLLSTRRPCPLELADLTIMMNLPVAPDLPRRLREEHPGSFDADRIASLLEGTRLGRSREAFDRSIAIPPDSLTKNQRLRHFDLLYALAQEVGPDAMRPVERLAPELLVSDVSALKLFFADRYLSSDRTEAAREMLDEIRDEDDPRWLQLHAHLMHRLGDPDEAMTRLIEASKRVPAVELSRQIAQIAFGLNRFDVVAEALEKVVALDPSDIRSRRNLASAFSRLGRLRQATAQYRELRRLDPNEPIHGTNEAASLALSGDLPAALRLYDELCNQDGRGLDVVLGRAEVLRLLDRPLDAFLSLQGLHETFREEPRFLMLSMSLAYAAGEDKSGSEILGELRELQGRGKAPAEILRRVSLDEMKDLLVERREMDESLTDQVIAGQVPWVMAEEAKGRSTSLGWALRTQPMAWCLDDPRLRAELSVYATNGFLVAETEANAIDLIRIACPEPGGVAAADWTGLLTLHSLGRIDEAGAYFSRILIPASYLGRVLEERSNLSPHQLSQKISLEKITAAIDSREITVVDDEVGKNAPCTPRVGLSGNSHPGDDLVRGVAEVVDVVYRLGRLGRDDYERIRESCERVGPADLTGLPPLTPNSALGFDLEALSLFAQLGCLGPVLRSFRSLIVRGDAERARMGLRDFRFRDDVRAKHEDLWRRLRDDPRFEFVAATPPAILGSRGIDPDGPVAFAFAAAWIACERGVPLLADDRAVQNSARDERRGGSPLAFGTDRLLERMGEAAILRPGEVADALMQLMRWRYRFVIPPAQVLTHLAGRCPEYPPGSDLEEVARYVHDCLADAGLSSQFEPTDPPTSIASRLRQAWFRSIVEFLMQIWNDQTWSVEAARRLTVWAARQLLPPVPATMSPELQGRYARLDHRIVLSLAFIASSTVKDHVRAHAGLRAIAETLGIDDRVYEAVASTVIAHGT